MEYQCPNCKRKCDRLHEVFIESNDVQISIMRCEECKETGLEMLRAKLKIALEN